MTHGVSFLPYVDEIVVLVDGVVSEVGSYKSLRARKGAFSEFIDTYAQEQNNQMHSESGNNAFISLHNKIRYVCCNDISLDCVCSNVLNCYVSLKRAKIRKGKKKIDKAPCIIWDHIYPDRDQDAADIELIPEREDTLPDSPLEDTVTVTLKRESSIRRSQRNGR